MVKHAIFSELITQCDVVFLVGVVDSRAELVCLRNERADAVGDVATGIGLTPPYLYHNTVDQ